MTGRKTMMVFATALLAGSLLATGAQARGGGGGGGGGHGGFGGGGGGFGGGGFHSGAFTGGFHGGPGPVVLGQNGGFHGFGPGPVVRGFHGHDYGSNRYGYRPYGYWNDYAYYPYDDSYYDTGSCYVVERRVHTAHGSRLQPRQ